VVPHTWLEHCGQYLPPDCMWIVQKILQTGTEMLRGRAWLAEREKLNRAEFTSLRWSRCEM